MSYIFTPGRCTKGAMYDTIINLLLSAGWQNISSNIADGDVLKSTGITGDKSYYLQFFPYYAEGLGISAANYNNPAYNIRTTTSYNDMGVRLCMKYTPGTAGAAGTILRPSQTVITVPVVNCPPIVDPSCMLDYCYVVDKNKLIIEIKAPNTLSQQSLLLYFGAPDTLYVKGQDSRNVLVAATSHGVGAHGVLWTSDYPDSSLGSKGSHYQCDILAMYVPKQPNVNGNFFLAEPYYSSAEVGMIGKLDGVYILPTNTQVNYGDIITVGTSKFKVITTVMQSRPYGSFYSVGGGNYTYLAIQVA